MATDKFDYVFIFNGGLPFTQTGNVDPDVKLDGYLAKRDQGTLARGIMSGSFGADDLEANVTAMMQKIREFCNNRINAIGQVVLLGRSAGATLALELGATLNAAGVAKLTFVGLSDVPMTDDGRKPPAKLTGDYRPTNSPVAAGASAPFLGRSITSDPVPNNTPPVVTLAKSVNAGVLINQFQVQGNHTRYSSKVKRWIWTSSMDGEVHGKLENNFTNRPFTVKNASDGAMHIELNLGVNWTNMCQEAANELVKF